MMVRKVMMRFREQATETAGLYSTVGFNDDARAFRSIPARLEVARSPDCSFLPELVIENRLAEDGAIATAKDLTYGLVKHLYRLKGRDMVENRDLAARHVRGGLAKKMQWKSGLRIAIRMKYSLAEIPRSMTTAGTA